MVLVVIVGLAIGGWLAVASRNRDQQSVTVARSSSAVVAVRTLTPAARTPPLQTRTAAAAAPTAVATVPPAATPTAAPTVTATAPPTVTPTAAPTVAATTAPAAGVAQAAGAARAAQGAWQIDEANVQVGTIVWSGRAVLSRSNTIALDVRKVSVGGRSVSRCERETELRAAFAMGVAAQTVPYQEVNCQGVSSTGEVRVSSFASDGRSFHGSFWLDGTKLGDFDARATSAP